MGANEPLVRSASKTIEDRVAARLPRWRAKHFERIEHDLITARAERGTVGGGTPLTERVVVMHGTHRGHYTLYAASGVLIGIAGPAEPKRRHRARLDIHACVLNDDWDPIGIALHPHTEPEPPIGDRILSVLIAKRLGDVDDLLLDPTGGVSARLRKVCGRTLGQDASSEPGLRERQLRRWTQRLALAPRRVIARDGASIGAVTPRCGRYGRQRLVLDGSGRRAAIVTRTIGATVSTTRHYVIDIDEPVDDRLRATALAVGLLWDWYTIAWDAG